MRKLGLAIVTLLVAGGCGPKVDHPPVIDAVMMPETATLGTDNLYTVSGQMSYHDDDHPVHTLRVKVPLVGMTYEYPAGDLYIGNIDPLTIKFAAQADNAESNLAELPQAQKDLLAQSAHVVDWVPGVSLEQTISQQRTGTELWMPIALLALALATAETFLAHWFSRPK